MLSSVINRLKSAAPILTDVRPAEDLDSVEKGTAVQHGTVLVIPFRERASANRRVTGGHLQRVDAQIFVALVMRRHDDSKGGKKALGFDDFKTAIERALAGWTPDPEAIDPFSLVGGEGQPLGNGVSVYVQTWETTRNLEGVIL